MGNASYANLSVNTNLTSQLRSRNRPLDTKILKNDKEKPGQEKHNKCWPVKEITRINVATSKPEEENISRQLGPLHES